MVLQELQSDEQVRQFLQSNAVCVVTFSAHWCGPCKASKPALEQLAAASTVPMAICYEDSVNVVQYGVRAFPTYILFQNAQEKTRVEGANMSAVQEMIQQADTANTAWSSTAGSALGGGGGNISAADARAARLAKLEGATAKEPASNEPEAANQKQEVKTAQDDVEMPDANAVPDATTADADATTADADATPADPTANLDPAAIQTLTQELGFPLLRAQKGLVYGNGSTVETAVEWIMQHQDDDDIDEPIVIAAAAKAQSYKCNECGKILSNMANLELHANKTGHSDFEESTQHVKPLTAQEKAQKIAEINLLLKEKRAERELAEKKDGTEQEMQRRNMGKEMAKTREQLDMEQRKREAALRKKEKEEFKRERQRLRDEIAKDKAERRAHQGKMSSKLGVEGYHPDAVQYDVQMDEPDQQQQPDKKKPPKANAAKIGEYIDKVSSYRAGGDGGKCLKVLKAYVGNVVDHPDDDKYKRINMDNKAFKTKIKPFMGAKNILLAVGFHPAEGEDALVLDDDADMKLLANTKEKLEKALIAYG